MTDEPDCQCDLTSPTTPRIRLGVFVALVALSLASACGGDSTPDVRSNSTNSPSPLTPVTEARAVQPVVTSDSPCMEAFAAAAAVSPYQDTHEDLFPAYAACTNTDDWKAADALHPAAIDGVDPVQYAMTVCAGNQEELGDTPICKAVNAPPAASSSLMASGQVGLLGVPLPEGAKLTERTPGDPANYVDPKEAYTISATASDIAAFFGRAMPESGWSKDGVSTETGLFFQKGNLMIVVIIGDGKFSLMGS